MFSQAGSADASLMFELACAVAEVTRSPLWKCSPPNSAGPRFTVFVIDCQSVAFNSSAGRIFLKMPA